MRVLIPLQVPAAAAADTATNDDAADAIHTAALLRVGDDTRALQERRTLVFDDSFEHGYDTLNSVGDTIVLVVDTWHAAVPDDIRKGGKDAERWWTWAALIMQNKVRSRVFGSGFCFVLVFLFCFSLSVNVLFVLKTRTGGGRGRR
jgi:hypothetical protein